MLNRRTAVEAGRADGGRYRAATSWSSSRCSTGRWSPGETPPSRAGGRAPQPLSSRTGGTILFDTRDQGEPGVSAARDAQALLRQLARGLNIPPLVPVPPDHVLTKSFYLLQEFPGRWTGGQVWVEPGRGPRQ